MFDNFQECLKCIQEMNGKGGGKAGAGLAAIVCGRSLKRGHTVQNGSFHAKEKEGWIDLLLLLFTGGCAF